MSYYQTAWNDLKQHLDEKIGEDRIFNIGLTGYYEIKRFMRIRESYMDWCSLKEAGY